MDFVLTALLVMSLLGSIALAAGETTETEFPGPGTRLTDAQVQAFAELALEGLFREYPNKPGNVVSGPEDVLSPKAMHPAFYGCFDWHSSVHGHWMLVRLLKLYPDCKVGARIRESLARNLTREKLDAEAAYFEPKENKSFERTYGWAWLLRLAAELRTWDDADGKRWAENLTKLEAEIVSLTKGFLPRLTWPIRTGQHPDTGFALSQFLDYARTVGDRELESLVVARARDFYLADRDYPVSFEPSGFDFFSTGLNEADLMRRVLEPKEFSKWLDGFFPTLRSGTLGNLLTPVVVSDVTDGKLVHLAGLDLVRAWTLHGIASALPEDDPRLPTLRKAVIEHCKVGLPYVFSGDYAGEHWLASFAVYVVTEVGCDD